MNQQLTEAIKKILIFFCENKNLRYNIISIIIWRAPRPCGASPTQPFNAVKMLKSKQMRF